MSSSKEWNVFVSIDLGTHKTLIEYRFKDGTPPRLISPDDPRGPDPRGTSTKLVVPYGVHGYNYARAMFGNNAYFEISCKEKSAIFEGFTQNLFDIGGGSKLKETDAVKGGSMDAIVVEDTKKDDSDDDIFEDKVEPTHFKITDEDDFEPAPLEEIIKTTFLRLAKYTKRMVKNDARKPMGNRVYKWVFAVPMRRLVHKIGTMPARDLFRNACVYAEMCKPDEFGDLVDFVFEPEAALVGTILDMARPFRATEKPVALVDIGSGKISITVAEIKFKKIVGEEIKSAKDIDIVRCHDLIEINNNGVQLFDTFIKEHFNDFLSDTLKFTVAPEKDLPVHYSLSCIIENIKREISDHPTNIRFRADALGPAFKDLIIPEGIVENDFFCAYHRDCNMFVIKRQAIHNACASFIIPFKNNVESFNSKLERFLKQSKCERREIPVFFVGGLVSSNYFYRELTGCFREIGFEKFVRCNKSASAVTRGIAPLVNEKIQFEYEIPDEYWFGPINIDDHQYIYRLGARPQVGALPQQDFLTQFVIRGMPLTKIFFYKQKEFIAPRGKMRVRFDTNEHKLIQLKAIEFKPEHDGLYSATLRVDDTIRLELSDQGHQTFNFHIAKREKSSHESTKRPAYSPTPKEPEVPE